jgi:hypothetical protein
MYSFAVIRTLEKVNEEFQELLQRSNKPSELHKKENLDNENQTSLNDIKLWLCLVKKLTQESHDQFK